MKEKISKKKEKISDDKIIVELFIPNNGLHYSLSNGEFIDVGYTVLPDHKILRKEKVYYGLPTKKSLTDWLARSKILSRVFYDGGQLLAQFDENHINIFYESGNKAIDISFYPAKDVVVRRFVVFEDGSDTPLGVLDTLGRGIIYDHIANIRFKYNQLNAVLLDPSVGPPRCWRWVDQFEEPEFENIITDNFISPPDEEIDNLMKQNKTPAKAGKKGKPAAAESKPKKPEAKPKGKGKTPEPVVEMKESSSHHIQIKKEITASTKVFEALSIKTVFIKISKYFTLVVCNQQNISLRFQYDRKLMKMELGVVLIDELIETDLMDPSCGANVYEEIPARTESIAAIHSSLTGAREAEIYRVKQCKRLKHLQGKDIHQI